MPLKIYFQNQKNSTLIGFFGLFTFYLRHTQEIETLEFQDVYGLSIHYLFYKKRRGGAPYVVAIVATT